MTMSTNVNKNPSVFNLKKYLALAVCIVIAIAATYLGKMQNYHIWQHLLD